MQIQKEKEKKEIFKKLRILLFRNLSTRIDRKHLSFWHLMLDYGDSLVWSTFFGLFCSHKKLVSLVEYSVIRCLQEESKLLGRVKACRKSQSLLLNSINSWSTAYKSIIRLFFWDVMLLLCIRWYPRSGTM